MPLNAQALTSTFGLDGKVAIITGGGQGIGRATARVFADAGATVVLAQRTLGPLEETRQLVEAVGGRALVVPTDVADEAAVEQLVRASVDAFGQVDVVVNNAGVVRPGQLGTTTAAEWDEALGINLRGAFLLTNAVFPLMRERRSGVIVNVASIAGQTGGTLASVNYTASKGGMISLTKAVARQMAPWGRANAVTPGQILTRMGSMTAADLDAVATRTPLGRIGEASEVAHAILFLASPASSFITGHTLSVNGGTLME
jgi:NAD(P)-dependent dehydrogenase (short-subunit alcohol dehydrogenase family)